MQGMHMMMAVLLFVCVCSSASVASAQTIRIPLKRHTLAPNTHPTRSAAALASQLYAQNGEHHALNLAVDLANPISLNNRFDRLYTGTVSVGTPGNDFNLIFDTGPSPTGHGTAIENDGH